MVSLLKSLLAVGAKRLCGFLLILLFSKETSSPRELDVFQAWQFRLSIRRLWLSQLRLMRRGCHANLLDLRVLKAKKALEALEAFDSSGAPAQLTQSL